MTWVGTSKIAFRDRGYPSGVEKRVGSSNAPKRVSRAGEVGPRRQRDNSRRKRQSMLVTASQQERKGKASAGRIADDGQPLRVSPIGQQPFIGLNCVVNRSWKRMLRGQPIVHGQQACTGRPGKTPSQMAV
jgi:hypothetical protein